LPGSTREGSRAAHGSYRHAHDARPDAFARIDARSVDFSGHISGALEVSARAFEPRRSPVAPEASRCAFATADD
jgi:hypothetical protein